MDYLSFFPELITSKNFFYYHGWTLSILWVLVSTIGILVRRINVNVHAGIFLITDLLTIFFTTGAWINVYPHIAYFWEWSWLKQMHIIGGSFFVIFLVFQHIWGAKTKRTMTMKSKGHRILGWALSNFARVVACLGWFLGNYEYRDVMFVLVLLLTILLFFASTYYIFYNRRLMKNNQRQVRYSEVSENDANFSPHN